jgi:hypothetical protein
LPEPFFTDEDSQRTKIETMFEKLARARHRRRPPRGVEIGITSPSDPTDW